MSASGQKRTLRLVSPMSAIPPKADIAGRESDVRFVPIADIGSSYGYSPSDIRIFDEKVVTSGALSRGCMMSQSESDLEAFRNFEKTAHDRLAKTYHDAFSAVTNRAIEPLLDAARVGEGTRLLDVASGPGTLAGRAAERGALVVGTDIAPSMVALARTLHPALSFREASAEDLPFATSSFDAVISSFGIGHFSNPDRVLAEFRRVLVPKGRAALSWWDGFAQNRINGIFFDAINELGVKAPGALPVGPSVDQFSDPDKFVAILRAAGFEVIGIDYVSFSHLIASVDELWSLALGSFVRVSTVIRAQAIDVQQRLRKTVEQKAQQYSSLNGFEIPIAFRVVSGMS
jgi:SAM-dependent methyltransferase